MSPPLPSASARQEQDGERTSRITRTAIRLVQGGCNKNVVYGFFGVTRLSLATRSLPYMTVTCEPSMVARPAVPWAPVIFVLSLKVNSSSLPAAFTVIDLAVASTLTSSPEADVA